MWRDAIIKEQLERISPKYLGHFSEPKAKNHFTSLQTITTNVSPADCYE